MALMQPCSADLFFKVCGFERWVVLQGRFKAAESKSDSALHGSRSANRKKREQNPRFVAHSGLGGEYISILVIPAKERHPGGCHPGG